MKLSGPAVFEATVNCWENVRTCAAYWVRLIGRMVRSLSRLAEMFAIR